MNAVVAGLIATVVAVPGSASAQVDRTPERPAPKQEGVEAVIPMNPSDPTYDIWKIRREDLSAGRQPGRVQGFPGHGRQFYHRMPKNFLALHPKVTGGLARRNAAIEYGLGPRVQSAQESPRK